jgi:hypothetical protein
MDDLVGTKGRHVFKAGGLANRYQWNEVQDFESHGEYVFPNINAFLNGGAASFTATLPGRVADRANRSWLVGVYFQDDFKATQRLTLNLGLRFEPITVPSDALGRDFNLRNVFTDAQTTHGPLFRNPSLKNIAPRFGFAWDPWGNGKTAVRGGFGIFYDPVLGYVLQTQHFQPPLFITLNQPNPAFPGPGTLRAPPTSRLNIQVVDSNMKNPHNLQYSLTIQREVFRETMVSVGYVGTRGIDLLRGGSVNLNCPTVSPVPLPCPKTTLQPGAAFLFPNCVPSPSNNCRINPAWADIDLKRADGNSWYNALQVSANRRFSHGLQFQAAYTFSRNIDEGSGIFFGDTSNSVSDPQDPFVRHQERGLSNLQVKHHFVLNHTYDLPGGSHTGAAGKLLKGWQLNGILTLSSGNPFTPSIVGDRARAFLRRPGQERPNIIGDPNRGSCPNGFPAGTPQCWFNPSAFALQPAGTFGDLGRNTLIGPGLETYDFAVTKNTAITERWTVQFRGEIFNMFNHPNFGTPNALVLAGTDPATILPTAGQIFPPTVTSSRQIQFGAKFIF